MYFVSRHANFKSLIIASRFYSVIKRSYYDILSLQKNCSGKEIKEAFIRLSKEYHPDRNKNPAAQDQFISILEAYNVLSKPLSRAKYDRTTELASRGPQFNHVYRPPVYYSSRGNTQYNYYYEDQYKSYDKHDQKPYYGVHKVKRVPNYVVLLLFVGLAILGCVLQLVVIRESFLLHRRNANERTKLLSEKLDRLKAVSEENGNDKQIQIMLDKISAASNPTIATASLGQALANERK